MKQGIASLYSFSEKDTQKIGAELAETIFQSCPTSIFSYIILLFGDLGSGKTAFSKGFADYLGIKKVLSPTFNIMKLYTLNHKYYNRLVHADLYRIKGMKELQSMDFLINLNQKGTISLIEWPDVIYKSLIKRPKKDTHIIKIYFSYGNKKNERIISYEKHFSHHRC